MKIIKAAILLLVSGIFLLLLGESATVKILSIDEFIRVSCEKDPAFTYILSEKLTLEYDSKLAVPVEELLLEAAGGYGISFSADHHPEVSVSLKKIMPQTASSYKFYGSSVYSGNSRSSVLGFTYSIDFIKNAFGRIHNTEERKAELNTEIAMVQILQSYESYLSDLIQYYYDWLKAYRTMLSAEVSYSEALKLLENVEKRKRWHIAYQVDVEKAKLQSVDKKQKVLVAKEAFNAITLRIAYSFGIPLDRQIIPDTANFLYGNSKGVEEMIDNASFDSSRTGIIYSALMELDSLKLVLATEELLPTLTGYGTAELGERNSDIPVNSIVSTGVSLSFPFRKKHEKLEVERLKVERQKISINADNVREVRKLDLALLTSDIEYRKNNIEIIEEQLELSEKIYQAELKDYESGRSSLNDLIQAQNTIQDNRLAKFYAEMEIASKRLKILDALDLLVTKLPE